MSEPSITCPVCGYTSHNPNDVSTGYCAHCHDWTGAITLFGPQDMSTTEQTMHYDRSGHPITVARWAWLFESGRQPDHPVHDYYRIAWDELGDGVVVSTVWTGTDAGAMMHGGPPEIFETMVFVDGEGMAQQRYSSEAEALATHRTLVRSIEYVGRTFLDELVAEQNAE